MGLKQKFIALAGVMGALMAIVSIIGYYMASTDLRKSVESEMKAMAASIAELKDNLVWLTKSAPMYGPPAPPSQPVTRAPRARK